MEPVRERFDDPIKETARASSVTQIGYKQSGCSPVMTQGDGGGAKAQSYCPDQQSHIEGAGNTASQPRAHLLGRRVMKANKGNNHKRKMEPEQQCVVCAGR